MTDRAGLSGEAAAFDHGQQVEFPSLIRDIQRLLDDHSKRFPWKVMLDRPLIHQHFPIPWLDPDPGNRIFPFSGCIVS
jgi:hypothetical protein